MEPYSNTLLILNIILWGMVCFQLMKCFILHFSLYKLKIIHKYILSVYVVFFLFNILLFGFMYSSFNDLNLIFNTCIILGLLMSYILIILKDTLIRLKELAQINRI